MISNHAVQPISVACNTYTLHYPTIFYKKWWPMRSFHQLLAVGFISMMLCHTNHIWWGLSSYFCFFHKTATTVISSFLCHWLHSHKGIFVFWNEFKGFDPCSNFLQRHKLIHRSTFLNCRIQQLILIFLSWQWPKSVRMAGRKRTVPPYKASNGPWNSWHCLTYHVS